MGVVMTVCVAASLIKKALFLLRSHANVQLHPQRGLIRFYVSRGNGEKINKGVAAVAAAATRQII